MSTLDTIHQTNGGEYVSMLLEGLGGALMPEAKRIDLLKDTGEAGARLIVALLHQHVAAWQGSTKAREYIPTLCKILGTIGGELATDTLMELAGPQYSNTIIPQYACSGLRELTAPRIVPEILKHALNPRATNRQDLAGILAKYPQALEAVLETLDRLLPEGHRMPEASRMLYCILVLAVRKDLTKTAMLLMLRAATECTNDGVRSEAAAAIARMIPRNYTPGNCDVLDEIISRLKQSSISDGCPNVRAQAALTIRYLEAWNNNQEFKR